MKIVLGEYRNLITRLFFFFAVIVFLGFPTEFRAFMVGEDFQRPEASQIYIILSFPGTAAASKDREYDQWRLRKLKLFLSLRSLHRRLIDCLSLLSLQVYIVNEPFHHRTYYGNLTWMYGTQRDQV